MDELHIQPAVGDEPGWLLDEDLELFATEDEAVARATERLGPSGGEIVIHDGGGEIRERIQVGVAPTS